MEETANAISGSGIVSTITDAFTGFVTGIGKGVVTLFQNLFTNANGSISTFAIVSLSMTGLGIATGVFYALMRKIRG